MPTNFQTLIYELHIQYKTDYNITDYYHEAPLRIVFIEWNDLSLHLNLK